MLKVLTLLGVMVLLDASIAAQTPAVQTAPARDGVIMGQVVDAATARPVGAVIVSLAGAGTAVTSSSGPTDGFRVTGGVPKILTGSDGRFTFRDLPAGSFTVLATKGGYSDGASGRRVIGGASQPVVLTAAQRTAETSVRMWKNAAMTGTVLDEAGEPIVGLQVRALRRTFTGGRRRFVPAGPSAVTDDRGVYRVSALTPGEYLVVTSQPTFSATTSAFADARTGRGSGSELASLLGPPGTVNGIQVGDAQVAIGREWALPPPPVRGRMQIYPTTFHPSALNPAQAIIVGLASGEERIGIDLQLQPVPTARVSGTLMGASGPASLVALRLVPDGVEEIASDALAPLSVSDAGGSFVFAAVPHGQYTLRASSTGAAAGTAQGAETQWLAMPLTVGGDDVDAVVAVMRPGLRITARLQFDGAMPRPPERSQVMWVGAPFSLESDDNLPPAAGGLARATVGMDGVTLGGYAAGKYRVRVTNSPAGWMFKTAMLNGVDVSEAPFEFTRDITDLVLTFTDRWSGIGGVVQGADPRGVIVLLFTTNPQAWANTGASPRRLKSTHANAKGEFGLSSVPPGEYYVVAVPEEQATDWREPKSLEALALLATQVSIAEGEHRTIDLRLKEVR